MRINPKRIRNPQARVKRRAVDRAKNKVQRRHTHAREAREFADADTLPPDDKQVGQQLLVQTVNLLRLLPGEDLGDSPGKGKRNRHRKQFTTPPVNFGAEGAYRGEVGAMTPLHWRLRQGFSMLRRSEGRTQEEMDYEG